MKTIFEHINEATKTKGYSSTIVTDEKEIDKLLSNDKIADNCVYATKGSYDNILALSYNNNDDEIRLSDLVKYLKTELGVDPNNDRSIEFIEYRDGNENTFKLV